MQRVLYEILRRSTENADKSQSRKRKMGARNDGKYAEELFTRESRGPRPGMIDWIAKRRRTEGDDSMRKTQHITE